MKNPTLFPRDGFEISVTAESHFNGDDLQSLPTRTKPQRTETHTGRALAKQVGRFIRYDIDEVKSYLNQGKVNSNGGEK